MNFETQIAQKLGVKPKQVTAAAQLIDEGNTIPFIARYRKELTDGLTDEQLRNLDRELKYLRGLQERKEDITRLLEEKGVLDENLQAALAQADTLQQVEDIYLPYRPKRRTRATVAIEKGFQPLADYIMAQKGNQAELTSMIEGFVGEQTGAETAEEAVGYAMDILAAQVSENARARDYVRRIGNRGGKVIVSKTKDAPEDSVYANYFDYEEPIREITPHRILAINRGEREGHLKIALLFEEEKILPSLRSVFAVDRESPSFQLVCRAIEDGYQRLLYPSIQTELRNELKERADAASIHVFASNLKPYLMQSPLKGKVILGMDPGYRTGCKLAVISETGEVLDHGVVHVATSKGRAKEAEREVLRLLKAHQVGLIAIGNGTASRETELFIADLIQGHDLGLQYTIVNESGASIYSASELGQAEFPDLDVTIRGAISIARRVQDPLAELVKIEPKHIGVGQYQHDVNQKQLDETLHAVVESCVNQVGVDVNTASKSLLTYVSGVTAKVADQILAHKRENGLIQSKAEIKKIKGIGPKTFQQCAGFLRIPESSNPLDNTGVHPESYPQAKKLLGEDLKTIDVKAKAEELEIGLPTLMDILEEMKKPGRDPRDQMPEPITRSDILTLEDLSVGMELEGTVRNVVDFGAFVDIGVGTDGLVHISQISETYIKHPSDVIEVSQVVSVRVIMVDKKAEKIGLSMKPSR